MGRFLDSGCVLDKREENAFFIYDCHFNIVCNRLTACYGKQGAFIFVQGGNYACRYCHGQ